MTFAWPWAFGGFLLILLLPVLHRLTRGQFSVPFSSLRSVFAAGWTWRQRTSWVPAFIQFLALGTLLFALARPRMDVVDIREMRRGIAIEMLLDVSSSMDMSTAYRDGQLTRLEAAKKVLEDFVAGDGDKLEGRDSDLIGLVTFARYADTICPLTFSSEAVVYLTREVEIQDRPNEDGTAYGDATALAAAHLKLFETLQNRDRGLSSETPEIKSKIIVLLTDGENNCGNHLPLQAAAMAREWGIRIYTISFGEPPGKQRVATSAGDVEMAEAMSDAERILRQMADMTGGIFRQAAGLDALKSVYAEIDELEKSELTPIKVTKTRELFPWFALAALGLIVSESALRASVWRIVP